MSKSLIIWWMLACFTNQELFAFTISQIYGEEILDEWKVYVSGPYGSRSYKDGDFFTDFHQSLNGRSVEPNHWPDAINLRSGDSIDAIQIFYGNYRGRLHGWEDGGGELHKIRLYDGDKIIRVIGRRGIGPGASIDQLTFHTKNDNVFGPFGGTGGYVFTAEPPKPDCYLAWISGRSNVKLDAISFHWRCPVLWREGPQQTIIEDMPYDESMNTSWEITPSILTTMLLSIATLL